jgi:hypothetical protein
MHIIGEAHGTGFLSDLCANSVVSALKILFIQRSRMILRMILRQADFQEKGKCLSRIISCNNSVVSRTPLIISSV